MKLCAAENCLRRVHCRGLCQPHYQQWYHGDKTLPANDFDDRLNDHALTCTCLVPEPMPGGFGECGRCRRLIEGYAYVEGKRPVLP